MAAASGIVQTNVKLTNLHPLFTMQDESAKRVESASLKQHSSFSTLKGFRFASGGWFWGRNPYYKPPWSNADFQYFFLYFDSFYYFYILFYSHPCFVSVLRVIDTPPFKAKAKFEWKEVCKNNTSKLKSKYFQTTVFQYNTSFDLVMAVYTSTIRVVR